MTEVRSAHPFHVYEAIHAQPERIEKIFTQTAEIERIADAVAAKARITFVGIGTSLHAARICESWMQDFTNGRFRAYVEQSFELLHHPPAFGNDDAVIVITHTGTSSASVEALHRARATGALTVAITGEACGEGARDADFRIETCEQEKAFAYTKSYTTALAALAFLITRVASTKNLLARAGIERALERLPELMRDAMRLEPEAKALAKNLASLARLEIFGSGVGWATANEAALKIKEACYIAAEGFETEEILHGPFSETDSRAALIGLLTASPSDERARQIFRAAGELKVFRAAIATAKASHGIATEQLLVVPDCDEWLAAFVHLIPLQLLTYFLAIERSTNPDSGRMEQTGHSAASRHYKY